MNGHTYTSSNYPSWMAKFAGQLNTNIVNGTITLPAEIGIGTIQYFQLTEGLEYIVSTCTLTAPFQFSKKPEKRFSSFTFCIDMIEKGKVKLDGTLFTAPIAFMYLRHNRDGHYETIDAGTVLHTVHFRIPENYIQQYFRQLLNMVAQNPAFSFFRRYQLLNDFAKNLVIPFLHNSCLDSMLLKQNAKQLFRHFLACSFGHIEGEEKEELLNKEEMETLLTVRSILLSRTYDKAPSITQLERLAGINKTYLKRKFKTLFSQTIHRFYINQKMVLAKNLVDNGADSITKIAYATGYTNISQFSRDYKKHFGVNPDEARKISFLQTKIK